jgi:hypothetical protein
MAAGRGREARPLPPGFKKIVIEKKEETCQILIIKN